MFGRLLGYLSGVWLHRRPDEERGSRFQVCAAVVNLTGSGDASREFLWPAVGLGTSLRVVERNLEHEPAADLLGGIESSRWSRCLLPWVPLMAGADHPAVVDRWKALAEVEPDRRRKGQFAIIALLFAARVKRKAVWEQKLEDWNVEDNEYVNEWIAVGEKRGEARGVALGEARGEARGVVAGMATTVLQLGAKRFGTPPKEVESALRAITDRDRLSRIVPAVLTATSWDDLLATS